MSNIVLIGAGNVAHHLAESFSNHPDLKLNQVYNHRKTKAAIEFTSRYQTELVTSYDQLITNADVYMICVKDDAIQEVVKCLSKLKLQGIVVHTSGSTELNILEKTVKHIGVYYPLQSFSRSAVIDWKTVPLLIEANTKNTLQRLKQLASSISGTVRVVNTSDRLKLHLAAVFASNFTNALYAAAFDYVEANLPKKDTDLLKPLMKQAFSKLEFLSPKQAQTGPAMRDDRIVMTKHLKLLKSNKELTAVYQLLSELIRKQQKTS